MKYMSDRPSRENNPRSVDYNTASRRYSANALVAAAISGALVFCVLANVVFARAAISADTFQQLDLFGEIFEQVHENYVSKPEDADLIKGAIDGMLATLDPHSNYLTAKDFQVMQEQTRGSFAGLGIQVTMENEGPDAGLVKIIAPIDDTPAARAGLKTDDLIVEIDGKAVQGMSIDEAISHLKGEKGTAVNIKVLRARNEEPFMLRIIRDIVTVQSVTSALKGEFGFIRLSTFSEQTNSGLRKALRKLTREKGSPLKGLVLDLRSNPGGLLDQAVAVADTFLEGGEIVSTRGRHARDTVREMGSPGDKLVGKPVIVLIDGGSASASEIVAGALQDRNRALLLGTKSFGKGSVQSVIPLQNGLQGALRLTTAKYYTPAGRSIQALGIAPDIHMPVLYPGQENLNERPSERDLPGALDVTESNSPDFKAKDKSPDTTEATGASAKKPAPIECGYEDDGKNNPGLPA